MLNIDFVMDLHESSNDHILFCKIKAYQYQIGSDIRMRLFFVLNTDITHVMMPDYSKQLQVTSPYTAESDGWLQCNLRSQGGLSTLRIDGSTAFAIGQTISGSSYTTNFITVPIAKGQTAVVDGIVVSIYFVPCIGI